MDTRRRKPEMMRALPAAVLLAVLGGCGAARTPPPAAAGFTEFYADSSVVGEVSAPAALASGETGMLALRLRLHNRSGRALELSESTRCTVLRWSVADTRGQTLEAPPNKPCARQVAARTLPPAHTIERIYEVPLTAPLYRTGNRYILRFSFWGYPGRHAFEMR